MNQGERSLKIVSISWGRIEVRNLGVRKDVELYSGGGREWDWTETGTQHVPGLQPADVENLLAHGATTVVPCRGMDQQRYVGPATIAYLEHALIMMLGHHSRPRRNARLAPRCTRRP